MDLLSLLVEGSRHLSDRHSIDQVLSHVSTVTKLEIEVPLDAPRVIRLVGIALIFVEVEDIELVLLHTLSYVHQL